MRRYDGVSEYRKAAQYRLHDAEELLEPPTLPLKVGDPRRRHLRGAMYLAGYAVECILKAYIILQNQPKMTLGEVDPILTTAAGHSLDGLLLRAGLEAQVGDRRPDWNVCRTWRPDWRYDPDLPSRGAAVNFVTAARTIHAWVRNMI